LEAGTREFFVVGSVKSAALTVDGTNLYTDEALIREAGPVQFTAFGPAKPFGCPSRNFDVKVQRPWW
jgi:hypothetical protein